MERICKIALVDDHKLFRNGLKELLNGHPDCRVVLTAGNGADFLAAMPQSEVDVVLMDIDMPVMNGFETAERCLKIDPGIKIITLSMHGDQEYYFKMVALGVKGFLLKDSDFEEVVAAIRIVDTGGSYFSQGLLRSLVSGLRSAAIAADGQHDILSQREAEILILICKGLSNQDIADELFISKRTVDKHRANILEKTNTKNTANMVVYAIKNGFVKI